MAELLVYPHCDMHVALQNPAATTLPFKVFRQALSADSTTYTLTDVTAGCTYRRIAPYRAVGTRIHDFVNIDPAAGTITGLAVGTNLIVIERNGRFIVARIQVHDDILGWWFGNSSITTALDPAVAHSQPSIYALFSNDAAGTDLVGDITGHGFVTLTSASPGTLVVDNANNQGRLRGVSEGTAQLNGSFLGINANLTVNVVDYGKARNNLVTMRAADIGNASEKHNILFLAEGFRATEKDKFDQIVQEVTDGLFTNARHEPFKTLQGSFNVFKSFQASDDSLVTCGFRVNDEEAPSFATGKPIPYIHGVSNDKSMYTPLELIRRVGLPLRNEVRNAAQLKALWATQSLANYEANKVDDTVIEAWRKSKSLGILEARDTFFGLMLGSRWADAETHDGPALVMPAADNDADANLAPFIERAYMFFTAPNATRHLAPDRRRHPPELHEVELENRGYAIMRYLGGLRLASPPNTALGTEWVPDGTFKRSRGLIAMITNDSMHGGTNFGDSTVTANSIAKYSALEFEYPGTNTATRKVMRRRVPAEVQQDLEGIINTVAHEFGHSFNLGDEYETRFGDKADAFSGYDNIASLDVIHASPTYPDATRTIDPDKVKWFDLLRMDLSTTLTEASSEQGNEIEVTIDPRQIPRWAKAKASGRQVHIRRIVVANDGAQLPLSSADNDYLVRLDIGAIDETAGKMRLGGMEMPASPFPVFPKGSLLFVPKRDKDGNLVYVAEKKVRAFIAGNQSPLNKINNATDLNPDDEPKDIPDFKPPCTAKLLIGVYEGAGNYTGLVYRPAGACKMRKSSGSYCHVCKWLIVNRIDASWHDVVDRNFYPEAKKNG